MYYGKLLRQIVDATRQIGEKIDQLTSAVRDQRIEEQDSQKNEWEQTRKVIAGLRPTPDEQTAAETNQKRRHGENLQTQRFLAFGTWLAFAAAGIYAFIAKKTMEVDQRPWIALTRFDATPQPGAPLTLYMPVQDAGKSPALNFELRVDYELVPSGQRWEVKYRNIPALIWRPGTMNPTDQNNWGPHFNLGYTLTPAQFERVEQGNLLLYFFGESRYQDIFGRQHYTRFCRRYDPRIGDNHMDDCGGYYSGTDSEQ
jgi:hypothetical protein